MQMNKITTMSYIFKTIKKNIKTKLKHLFSHQFSRIQKKEGMQIQLPNQQQPVKRLTSHLSRFIVHTHTHHI